MDCSICQRFRHSFFCPKCIQSFQLKHLHSRRYLESTDASLRELVAQELENMKKKGLRDQLAYVSQLQKIKQFRVIKEKLRLKLEVETQKLKDLKEANRQRKSYLQKCMTQLHTRKQKWTHSSTTELESLHKEVGTIMETNSHACRVLVKELMKLFRLNPGNPGGGVAPTVHGLPIPDDADFRATPLEHLNTALGHVVHFVNLVAMYLGVHLPFHLHFESSTSTAHFHTDRAHPIPIYAGTDPFPLGLAMLMHQVRSLATHLLLPSHLAPSPFAILNNLLACVAAITLPSFSLPDNPPSARENRSASSPHASHGFPSLRQLVHRRVLGSHTGLVSDTSRMSAARRVAQQQQQQQQQQVEAQEEELDNVDDDDVLSTASASTLSSMVSDETGGGGVVDVVVGVKHRRGAKGVVGGGEDQVAATEEEAEAEEEEEDWVHDGFEAPGSGAGGGGSLDTDDAFEQVAKPLDRAASKKWVHLSVLLHEYSGASGIGDTERGVAGSVASASALSSSSSSTSSSSDIT